MSGSSPSPARHSAEAISRMVADRRRHKRCVLPLHGRFMRATKEEFPCRLNDISVGGMSICSPVEVVPGERIVAYFDKLGGLEGVVVRRFEDGFAVRINSSLHKREKLAAQLTWLINRDEMSDAAERRHERVAVKSRASSLILGPDAAVDCRVLDVSLSGASLGTDARPSIGTDVMLGKMRCRVMRHHDRGIGVQFLDIQEPDALRRYFG